MMDVGKVIGAIAIAAAVGAGPLWRGTIRRSKVDQPALPTGFGPCLEPKDSMRTSHPARLSMWRDQAVRQGQRTYRTTDGRDLRIGLAGTCLGCHGEASRFCDRCHDQIGVVLSCWQCHPPSPIGRR